MLDSVRKRACVYMCTENPGINSEFLSLCLFLLSDIRIIHGLEFQTTDGFDTEKICQGFARTMKLDDERESVIPFRNFNTPAKDLVYKDLLTSTFTQASHEGYDHLSCSDNSP